MLQSNGIAASEVASSDAMSHDPQLVHRGHFVELEHIGLGKVPVEASAYRLSRTPGRVARAAPTLGRDNAYVLEKILGYGPDQIATLISCGVLR